MKLHRLPLYVAAVALVSVPLAVFSQYQGSTTVSLGSGAKKPAALSPASYEPLALEAHLTQDQLTWIRPGLKLKINSFVIPADRRPEVEYSITDELDQPLDRLGKVTPGAVSISQILAWWDPVKRQYTSYTTRAASSTVTGISTRQASADSGGVWTDIEVGRSKYKFATVLPAGFDQTKTTTLGVYSSRNTTELLGKNYYANIEYDFRPDAAPVTEKWQNMTAANACNRCHNPISAHGGSRQDVKLCVMCHTPQTIDPDTGNTVDMKVMTHKIHRGKNLPSVLAGTPYRIIGNQGSVHDYSHVSYPQDLRNCTTCHEAAVPDAQVAFTRPTRASCGSCHDNVDFATGTGHVAGAFADDTTCATCHKPQGEKEFDASVIGAHTIPEESTQLKGLKIAFVSITNTAPGQKPTVVFNVKNNDNSVVVPSTLATLNLLLGGSTVDNARYFRESAKAATASGSNYSYTFTAPIPADATGSWTLSADVYRNATIETKPGQTVTLREAAINPVLNFAVTDAVAVARRKVVDIALCNKCHERLALHGGQRLQTTECVICHNRNETDASRRPAANLPAESIDMTRMIHRIHTGENLTQDYTVYGFGGTPIGFNEVLFPADIRECTRCHSGTTYTLPVAKTLGNVNTPRDWFTPLGPGTNACLGCHDNRDAAAHAFLNTAPFGEACASCHGEGSDWAVTKVHAR